MRTTVIRQFGRPQGTVGRLVGWIMALRGSNRKRNRWVVSLLDVRPTDRVLEIGFGPGIAVAELARRADRGRVHGVDHSAVMVRQARRRNRAAVRAGRVHLVRASVDELPAFDGGPFDVIVAVNTVGFWPRPVDQLARLRGLLRPGGRIALASQPRCPGATAGTTARAGDELRDLMRQAGFGEPRIETLALTPPVVCVIACG
jgi:ubiquinone/menaquinone biosynthesis C-methylase UbiE